MKKALYIFIASAMIIACNKKENHDHSHSEMNAKNEAIMQNFYDQVMNTQNLSMIDSFIADDFVDQQMPSPYSKDKTGLKSFFTEYFTAYPDINIKTNFMKSWGDTVMAHVTITGTNNGAFMGMPATNKQINVEGVDIVVIKDGKATHHWGYQEDMKMMEQLGLMGGPPADAGMKK